MNIRLIVFLTVVLILVIWAIIFEVQRQQPWDSDVFFSSLDRHTPSFDVSQEFLSS